MPTSHVKKKNGPKFGEVEINCKTHNKLASALIKMEVESYNGSLLFNSFEHMQCSYYDGAKIIELDLKNLWLVFIRYDVYNFKIC